MGAPLLIGAGVGALGSAVMGGSPLKGALLGGVGGGLTGGMSSLLGGGSFLEGAGLNSLASNAATTAAADAGAAPFEGAVFDKTTGTWLNPNYYAGQSVGIPTYTGGDGAISNAFGDLKSKIPDWVTPNNMIGAANIASKFTPQQYSMPAASGGGISHGSYQPKNSDLPTGILLTRKQSNPFLLG